MWMTFTVAVFYTPPQIMCPAIYWLALNVYVSGKFLCWNYPQCDGVRRQGLWQVLGVRLWGHYDHEVMGWGAVSQVVLVIKNWSANAGDMRDVGLILESETSTGGGMTTHSSILPWEISWTKEAGRLQSTKLQRTWPSWSIWEHRYKWGHGSGALVNGITAFVRVTGELAFTALFSAIRGYHAELSVCNLDEKVLTRTQPCCILIPDCQPPEPR